MDAIEAHLKAGNDLAGGLDLTLWLRLLAAPQSTSSWLYRHQDSPLVPILARWAREQRDTGGDQPLTDALAAIPDTQQRQFMQQVLMGR